ncbi:dihydrofolate reductase family protein [Dyadobacter sandarakinus]|uniref:Dihydrofolate reductase family protein n=1 Tax=Dyadobacter sandarakinus TaxID=2747268 RepID=A0ABX7IAF7_9BACT|nr:dihydrofolate reductase family protein [Dyadobacter sandarakinus]QRR03094.1 dihydrofolate reductase family protein [Dyadobacter sandarakinus]
MRRIIINEHLSLDGVIQGPGGPEEDTTGGFELGGWSPEYADEITGQSIMETIHEPYDLLLGRFTYKIWDEYWPFQTGSVAEKFNNITKYVATKTLQETSWENTVLLNGDVIEQVKALKASDGMDLHLWGSGNFVQALLQNGLIDRMNIWLYPVILGKGKRLFLDGAVPGSFRVTRHAVTPTGVAILSYEADGNIKIGQASA